LAEYRDCRLDEESDSSRLEVSAPMIEIKAEAAETKDIGIMVEGKEKESKVKEKCDEKAKETLVPKIRVEASSSEV
jgi:hypothetical protein